MSAFKIQRKNHFNQFVHSESDDYQIHLQISVNKVIENDVADLKRYHSQYRDHIRDLLNDGESSIKSIVNAINEIIRRLDQSTVLVPRRATELEDHECRDVHISSQAKPVMESKV